MKQPNDIPAFISITSFFTRLLIAATSPDGYIVQFFVLQGKLPY
jgi:hypothetical protein